jgi:hypothetical protein
VCALRTKLIKGLREKDVKGLEGTLKNLYSSIPYKLDITKEAYLSFIVCDVGKSNRDTSK